MTSHLFECFLLSKFWREDCESSDKKCWIRRAFGVGTVNFHIHNSRIRVRFQWVSPPKTQSRFLSNIAIISHYKGGVCNIHFYIGLSRLFVTFFQPQNPILASVAISYWPKSWIQGLPSGKLSTFIGPFKVTQDSASMSSCARVSVSVSKLVHKIQRNAHTYIFRDFRLWLLRHVIWILLFLWNFSYRPCSDYWSRNPPRSKKIWIGTRLTPAFTGTPLLDMEFDHHYVSTLQTFMNQKVQVIYEKKNSDTIWVSHKGHSLFILHQTRQPSATPQSLPTSSICRAASRSDHVAKMPSWGSKMSSCKAWLKLSSVCGLQTQQRDLWNLGFIWCFDGPLALEKGNTWNLTKSVFLSKLTSKGFEK